MTCRQQAGNAGATFEVRGERERHDPGSKDAQQENRTTEAEEPGLAGPQEHCGNDPDRPGQGKRKQNVDGEGDALPLCRQPDLGHA